MTHPPFGLPPGLAERDLDALLGEDGVSPSAANGELQGVATLLAGLHRLVEMPAPRPSAELAAVLTHGLVSSTPAGAPARIADRRARSRRLRRGALAVGLSAGITASLIGGAAASDRLPDGAQDAWEKLVEAVDPRSKGPAGDDPRRAEPPAGREHRERVAVTDEPGQDGGGEGEVPRPAIGPPATEPPAREGHSDPDAEDSGGDVASAEKRSGSGSAGTASVEDVEHDAEGQEGDEAPADADAADEGPGFDGDPDAETSAPAPTPAQPSEPQHETTESAESSN